jgi:hypothetical protein
MEIQKVDSVLCVCVVMLYAVQPVKKEGKKPEETENEQDKYVCVCVCECVHTDSRFGKQQQHTLTLDRAKQKQMCVYNDICIYVGV